MYVSSFDILVCWIETFGDISRYYLVAKKNQQSIGDSHPAINSLDDFLFTNDAEFTSRKMEILKKRKCHFKPARLRAELEKR